MPRTKSLTYISEYRRSVAAQNGDDPLVDDAENVEHVHVARAENDRRPDDDVWRRAMRREDLFLGQLAFAV